MNFIIKILTGFLLLPLAFPLSGQDYRFPLDGIRKVVIESPCGIIVRSHKKEELLIKPRDTRSLAQDAEWASTISDTEDAYDSLGQIWESKEGVLMIKDARVEDLEDLEIFLPPHLNISLSTLGIGSLLVDGFTAEVEALSTKGDIDIKNASGPIVAKSNVGDIKVRFVLVNQSGPSSIISSAGDLYIDIAASASANLKFASRAGRIYSDFPEGQSVTKAPLFDLYQLNGGGVEIKLLSSAGNIYLRTKAPAPDSSVLEEK